MLVSNLWNSTSNSSSSSVSSTSPAKTPSSCSVSCTASSGSTAKMFSCSSTVSGSPSVLKRTQVVVGDLFLFLKPLALALAAAGRNLNYRPGDLEPGGRLTGEFGLEVALFVELPFPFLDRESPWPTGVLSYTESICSSCVWPSSSGSSSYPP